MAVVVQRMIEPAAAGVLFTANPITGTRTEFVVGRRWLESLDLKGSMGDLVVSIGGRMFLDLTALVRSPRLRPASHRCVAGAPWCGPDSRTMRPFLGGPLIRP